MGITQWVTPIFVLVNLCILPFSSDFYLIFVSYLECKLISDNVRLIHTYPYVTQLKVVVSSLQK